MPTAQQYDTLARRFDARADAVTQLGVALVAAVPPGIVSGPYAPLIDVAAQANAANLAALAHDLHDLAAACRARAQVCAAYTAAVRRHRLTTAAVGGMEVPPPRRPAAWAEVG